MTYTEKMELEAINCESKSATEILENARHALRLAKYDMQQAEYAIIVDLPAAITNMSVDDLQVLQAVLPTLIKMKAVK